MPRMFQKLDDLYKQVDEIASSLGDLHTRGVVDGFEEPFGSTLYKTDLHVLCIYYIKYTLYNIYYSI